MSVNKVISITGPWEEGGSSFLAGKIPGNLINSDSLRLESVIIQPSLGWSLPFHFLWVQ